MFSKSLYFLGWKFKKLKKSQNVPKHIVWMFESSPNSHVQSNVTPNVTVLGGRFFGRWLSHEGGTLINRISALIQEISLAYTTHEDTTRSLQPTQGPSSNHAGTPNPDLQPPELRNQFQLLKSPLVCGILLYQPEQTKTTCGMDCPQQVQSDRWQMERNVAWKTGNTLTTISQIVFGLIIKYYLRSPLAPKSSKASGFIHHNINWTPYMRATVTPCYHSGTYSSWAPGNHLEGTQRNVHDTKCNINGMCICLVHSLSVGRFSIEGICSETESFIAHLLSTILEATNMKNKT